MCVSHVNLPTLSHGAAEHLHAWSSGGPPRLNRSVQQTVEAEANFWSWRNVRCFFVKLLELFEMNDM